MMDTSLYNGQAAQDYFVRKVLKEKRDGTFLEIGSRDPVEINNSYRLEMDLGWRGFMVEYDISYEHSYLQKRPKSIPLMRDATKIDYRKEFEKHSFPKVVDYLQIDLEVENRSTLTTLENLEKQCMRDYTFRVITFEHDIYRGDFFNTRSKSRYIFDKHGYELVFKDVKHNGFSYEDWYVHPDHVDMEYIHTIRTGDSLEYSDIVKRL